MRIAERVVGDVTVLDAEGRLTANDGHRTILNKVDDLLANGRRDLVVNLRQVPYMDSTCVGELIGAFLKARKQGATLKLAGVVGHTAVLLKTVKLDKVLEVFDSDTAAVASFRPPDPTA